ncbi:hypothetical protein CONPUDRAFT_145828 [Coniophora puteana RWD-64-598 SS2]|uniref:Uncharacterized protein n=1 Tax=Coniophora puteana (strain RWD-64-598) TaxID=741705 RepID=A0A5M3MJ91_CONPW|nr:uncharacterized protein CONPUDRAFT_145828 [Coniophora puteana RWD-64-598 SS2]EIW78705.1 hypothetical protein CONPUDRAFT_145828 [Coniophora puteana RWD-64-598 SS2]
MIDILSLDKLSDLLRLALTRGRFEQLSSIEDEIQVVVKSQFQHLFSVNDSVEIGQYGEVREILSVLANIVDRVDKAISRLNRFKSTLEESQRDHSRLISLLWSLPTETLSSILTHAVPLVPVKLPMYAFPGDSQADMPEVGDISKRTNEAIKLTHVCGRWREVALATPCLWNPVQIYWPPDDSERARVVTLLARSHPLPTYVFTYVRSRDASTFQEHCDPELFDSLKDRCHILDVAGDLDQRLDVSRLMNSVSDWPQLGQLTLPGAIRVAGVENNPLSLSNVSRLQLYFHDAADSTLFFSLRWERLQSLVIPWSWKRLVMDHVLSAQNFPCLEEFYICSEGLSIVNHPPSSVVHPSLHTFGLLTDAGVSDNEYLALLQHTVLSNLSILIITMRRAEELEIIADHLVSSRCALPRLVVKGDSNRVVGMDQIRTRFPNINVSTCQRWTRSEDFTSCKRRWYLNNSPGLMGVEIIEP